MRIPTPKKRGLAISLSRITKAEYDHNYEWAIWSRGFNLAITEVIKMFGGKKNLKNIDMKMKGKNLEFISFIKRDGSGTIPVGTEWNTEKDYPKTDDVSYLNEDLFHIHCLSLSNKTYIAHGFNSWIVKKRALAKK